MNDNLSIFISIFFAFNLLSVEAKEGKDDLIIHDVSTVNSINNICYSEKGSSSILVSFENTGTELVTNVLFNWYLDNIQNGIVSWNGNAIPGQTVDLYITGVSFSTHGNYTLQVWNSITDDDSNNDSLSLFVEVLPELTLDVFNDSFICKGRDLPVVAPASFSSFTWSTNETTPNVLLSQGSYTVTATDSFGCTAVDSFTISNFIGPESLLPDDTVLCTGDVFNPAVPAGFYSYLWSGDSFVDSSGITSEGIYVLTVIDSNQCTYTDSLNVNFSSVPTPTLPNYVNVCIGDTADISVTSQFVSYLWSTGDTVNAIQTISPGVFHVTVTGNNGCIGIDSVEVLIRDLPVVDFYDTLMCDLEPIVIGIGWFETYNWSTGDNSQFPMVGAPGWYYVTVTDENNCESVDSVEVLNQNVNLDLGPDLEFCTGDGKFLLLGHFDSYLWSNGDTTSVHWLGAPGIHSVTVTENFCSVSDEILIVEAPYPVADFNEVVSSPYVEFINMSNINTGLIWDFGDGSSSNKVNPTHSYLNPGIYNVELTAQNKCDTTRFRKTVGIFPQAAANSLIGNGEISVFPTLAYDELNLKLHNLTTQKIEYTVYDITGKLLIFHDMLYNGGDGHYVLSISQFASGTYYLRVEGEFFDPQVTPFVKK